MTIASAITAAQGRVAAAYTAVDNKGGMMPETQNLSNLPAAIESIPSGGGTEITAKNLSGDYIMEGEKVYFHEKRYQPLEAITVAGTFMNGHIINPNGRLVHYYNAMYLIDSANTCTKTYNVNYIMSLQGIQYDERGNVYMGKYKMVDDCTTLVIHEAGTDSTTDMCYLQDDYVKDFKSDTTYSTFNLYKVNENFDVFKKWEVTCPDSRPSTQRVVIIGDHLYFSNLAGSISHKVGVIDYTAGSITLDTEASGKFVLYATKDNKLAIVATTASQNGDVKGVSLVSVNNDYTLGSAFSSSNAELNTLLALTGNLDLVYNRNTGVLTICTANTDGNWGVFKYNGTDFDTVTIDLGTPTYESYQYITLSQDMTKLQMGRFLYKLAQTNDGSYEAVAFSKFGDEGIYTGIAKTSGGYGENITVETAISAINYTLAYDKSSTILNNSTFITPDGTEVWYGSL